MLIELVIDELERRVKKDLDNQGARYSQYLIDSIVAVHLSHLAKKIVTEYLDSDQPNA